VIVEIELEMFAMLIEGLWDWSTKSQTSIPLVFVMKITPGRVGEKAPHVFEPFYV